MPAHGRALRGDGVLGAQGGLSEFVSHGIDLETQAEIGALPEGRGVLGHRIGVPVTLRPHDLTDHPARVGFPRGHPVMRCFPGLPVRVPGGV